MTAPELADLVASWPVQPPWSLRPVGSGTNNLSRFVDAASGRFFLRVYQNTADAGQVGFEHRLLAELDRASLPFRVPSPVTARDGRTVAATADGRLAALFRVLPGEPLARRDVGQIRRCGEALGQLHRALARIDLAGARAWPTYGDLERVHPLVPDPLAAVGQLGLGEIARRRVARIVRALAETAPGLYGTLPRQLTHGDPGPGNMLQVEGRISAVLDFEFAGPDLRAVDAAVGWYWSIGPNWDGGRERAFGDAFLEGYLGANGLTAAELSALPTLSRLERTVALLHRIGRWRQGLAAPEEAREQAERLLRLDDWLSRARSRPGAAAPRR